MSLKAKKMEGGRPLFTLARFAGVKGSKEVEKRQNYLKSI